MSTFCRTSPANRLRCVTIVAIFGVTALGAENEAVEEDGVSLDALYETGRALFDQLAPAELKEQFEFPTKERWDEFAGSLNAALEDEDLSALAEYLPDAKAALVALRALPGYEDYADWLQERIDYIEAAKDAAATPASEPEQAVTKQEKEAPGPVRSKEPAPSPAGVAIPHYELWLERMIERPIPANAGKLLPVVREAFEAEGVAPEIAWLAEAESTFNPNAKSPVGAKGLFQFMPETAKGLGLSTFMPDERTHPEKSARAAAKYLRELYGKFGDWPLAFAAYNAGEGRVRRLLKKHEATTFAGIASVLPSETRMYVPKVCATIAVRAGMTPERIPAPRS